MNVQRTPPAESLHKPSPLSASDPNISALLCNTSDAPHNITQRTKRPRSEDENIVTDLSSFKEEILSSIKILMTSQSDRLDKLEERIISIQAQNSNIQSTNKEIEKSMNFLSENIKSIEGQLSTLEQERKQLSLQISSMDYKLENLEISTLKTCIEIRNVPKVAKEKKQDLYTYAYKLCDTLKINIQQSDIRDVYRLPSTKEKTFSSLSIELTNTLMKNQILDAVKVFNKSHRPENINSSHLGLAHKQSVFISDLLIPKKKRLLFLARDFAKEHNYTFVWPSNGHIYIRKEEGKPYIMIKNESHLNELKKNAEQSINK